MSGMQVQSPVNTPTVGGAVTLKCKQPVMNAIDFLFVISSCCQNSTYMIM